MPSLLSDRPDPDVLLCAQASRPEPNRVWQLTSARIDELFMSVPDSTAAATMVVPVGGERIWRIAIGRHRVPHFG